MPRFNDARQPRSQRRSVARTSTNTRQSAQRAGDANGTSPRTVLSPQKRTQRDDDAVLKALCSRIPWCEPSILESALELALEIAREGRERRRIGTLFTMGKADDVLAASRALILDPLAGQAPARTHISDPDLRGTMKELAQLDGAFVISEAGNVMAACRYLDASVEQIDLPLGFGSRHLAAASISRRVGAGNCRFGERRRARVLRRTD